MTAALKIDRPSLVDAGLPANVADAAIKRMEEDSWIIKGLRKQNERLKEEKLNAELEASVAIATAKLTAAQAITRIAEIEKRLDRLNNYVQDLPTRDEFKILHDDYYAHSAGQ